MDINRHKGTEAQRHKVGFVLLIFYTLILTSPCLAEILRGTLDDDTISGGSGHDQIFGMDGTDIIYGNEGDDEIYGGEGRDTLYGGDGEDKLYGEGLDAKESNDYQYKYVDDKLYGGDGDDLLNGGGGNDWLLGGAGDDTYIIPLNSHGLGKIIDARGSDTLQIYVTEEQEKTMVMHQKYNDLYIMREGHPIVLITDHYLNENEIESIITLQPDEPEKEGFLFTVNKKLLREEQDAKDFGLPAGYGIQKIYDVKSAHHYYRLLYDGKYLLNFDASVKESLQRIPYSDFLYTQTQIIFAGRILLTLKEGDTIRTIEVLANDRGVVVNNNWDYPIRPY